MGSNGTGGNSTPLTPDEVELLGRALTRAGVNRIEDFEPKIRCPFLYPSPPPPPAGLPAEGAVHEHAPGREPGERPRIRGSVLRWFLTAFPTDGRSPPQELLEGYVVVGPLDLSFAELHFPLTFHDCEFPDGIKLHHARLRHLRILGGRMGGLHANGLDVDGDCAFGEGTRVAGEVQLRNARVEGDLSFGGAVLENADGTALHACGAQIRGNLLLDKGLQVDGAIALTNATVHGNLQLDGSRVHARDVAIDARRMIVNGNVTLLRGFECSGEITLIKAKVCGNLNAAGAKLSNGRNDALSCDSITVEGSVFLKDRCEIMGKARFVGASIAGDLDCKGAVLGSGEKDVALSMGRCTVGGNVYLSDLTSRGTLRLNGAKVGGGISFDASRLEPPPGIDAVSAESLTVEGDVSFTGGEKKDGVFHVSGRIDLGGCDIGGNLEVARMEFGVATRTAFSAQGGVVKGTFRWEEVRCAPETDVDLGHFSVGPFDDDANSWPEAKGRLHLGGFTYATISPQPIRSRLEWLARQPARSFDPQPYEQLGAVLRRSGHEDEAKWVMIEKYNVRLRDGGLDPLARSVSRLHGMLLGYGYDLRRAVAIVVVFLLLGAIVFTTAGSGGVFAMTKRGDFRDGGYPALSPVAYSVDAFFPVVDLHQETYWLPDTRVTCAFAGARVPCGSATRWYLWLHIALGWTLTTWIAAGLARLVRRDP